MAEENTKTVDINLMIMAYCDKKKIIDNGAIKGNESHAILKQLKRNKSNGNLNTSFI